MFFIKLGTFVGLECILKQNDAQSFIKGLCITKKKQIKSSLKKYYCNMKIGKTCSRFEYRINDKLEKYKNAYFILCLLGLNSYFQRSIINVILSGLKPL